MPVVNIYQTLALFAVEAGLESLEAVFADDGTGRMLRRGLRRRAGIRAEEISVAGREKAGAMFAVIRSGLTASDDGLPELPAEYSRWESVAARPGCDFFGHRKNTRSHRITLAVAGMRQFTIRRLVLKTGLKKCGVRTWVLRKFQAGFLEREMKYGTYVYRLKSGIRLAAEGGSGMKNAEC